MAQSNTGSGNPGPQDNWQQSWEEQRGEIDRAIVGALGQGRSVDDAFTEVSTQSRSWLNDDGSDAGDYNSRFREYYESRLADLERGGALARQDNGSFYVNPEYASGEGPGNTGTVDNLYAEGATSSRSSAGGSDPAEQD